MTQTRTLLYGLIVLAVLAFAYLIGTQTQKVFAGSPPGIATTAVVATTTAVGPQLNKVLFTADNCNSRIVSTTGSAVMLTFFDPSNGDVSSTTLTSMVGAYQAASTTVAYDSEQYGCGKWFVFGVASTTITTVSTR